MTRNCMNSVSSYFWYSLICISSCTDSYSLWSLSNCNRATTQIPFSFQLTYYHARKPFNASEQRIFKVRTYTAIAEVLVLIIALYVYWRHKAYCEPGSTHYPPRIDLLYFSLNVLPSQVFSAFALCEWTIVALNITFHSMAWFDYNNYKVALYEDQKETALKSK